MPLDRTIYSIEITLGRGRQLARVIGDVAKLIAKEGKSATLKLPSGEVRLISKNCSATVGQVGNAGVNQKSLGRAGSKCWLGKHPIVRGVVMDPTDHPHGGAANASHNMGLNEASLVISNAEVNEGATMKKIKPRARGQSYLIKRPTCHISIVLEDISYEEYEEDFLRRI
ncbi:hypothetical protein POTOM_061883 [Populus tomentosa]|uniref:Large ribosomal subunit protein uL2 C-terminal domain-containing protein n=1 Tax=Populus tomentosa TaxID=118781 RepID=A0A8X7XQ10_POPTO|nr:hypothetical protein POTOM_061883 [Populus tomentosa]